MVGVNRKLFFAPHAALAYFVAACIGARLDDLFERDVILSQFWV